MLNFYNFIFLFHISYSNARYVSCIGSNIDRIDHEWGFCQVPPAETNGRFNENRPKSSTQDMRSTHIVCMWPWSMKLNNKIIQKVQNTRDKPGLTHPRDFCFSSPRLVYFMPQMCLIALQTCKSTLFTFHIASQEGPVKFFIQSYANKFSHALIKYRFDIN